MIEGAPPEILPSDPRLRMRRAGPIDEPFIRELFREVLAEQFAGTGLPSPILEQVVAQQFRSQTVGYGAQYPDAISLIVMWQGTAIGRLLLDCAHDRWHIIDIALSPAARGCGLGSDVLAAVATDARQRGVEALTLSVLTNNWAARRFYARQGFAEIGQAGAAHISMKKILA